jgi:hypothetical protein
MFRILYKLNPVYNILYTRVPWKRSGVKFYASSEPSKYKQPNFKKMGYLNIIISEFGV